MILNFPSVWFSSAVHETAGLYSYPWLVERPLLPSWCGAGCYLSEHPLGEIRFQKLPVSCFLGLLYNRGQLGTTTILLAAVNTRILRVGAGERNQNILFFCLRSRSHKYGGTRIDFCPHWRGGNWDNRRFDRWKKSWRQWSWWGQEEPRIDSF